MTTITDKKQYPGEQYLNELITNIEFAARAPVEVVRAMAAELQKRREADSAEPVSQTYKLNELSGNYPDIPDSSVPAPGKGVTGERIRIKPHVYRELVNRLHDTAVKCAVTQQLRERISRVLGDVITPDHHKQAEKSGLERCHLEAALNIKPGHTLGVIDAMLVHEMAKALLPLVADKIPNKAEI
ncbi:hypothetical protein ABH253_003420 [Escherichia albertii]|uniref:hypothetical protein n=1 Tax=Escherichia albertii TaxID=208962 RepID=UPI000E5BB514|nr:hypothetical protein [Escherichia albertii]MCU7296797.1 hypothetical protein [Escherichia albertii]